MIQLLILIFGFQFSYAMGAEQAMFYECSPMGTFELVENPSSWADDCFYAVNRRYPNPDNIGETDYILRDIDLDGKLELLEIRGTGNSSKQIYVFSETNEGYKYMGVLNAHPSFMVERSSEGEVQILYKHRFGVDDIRPVIIKYVNSEFIQVNDFTSYENMPSQLTTPAKSADRKD